MGTADGDRGKTGERKDECDDKLDTSDGSEHSSDTDSDSTDESDENVHANDRNSASSTCIEQDIPARVPALQALYTFIIRSCFDKASTVRMRAMFHLLPLIENDDHCAQLDHYARKMFEEAPKVFVGEGEVILNELEELEDDHEEVLERMFMDDSEIVINNLVLHIILSGIVDDTVGVRKYSILALQAYFARIRENSEAGSAVNSLKDRCLDSSQMVRRQAALTLDHLLSTNSDLRELLENCWLTTVLPMINDRERNVQLLIAQLVTC
ncbi:hypothetical protein KIN20_024152 [Parelaphostrongylus tenuis]|uniref:Condensin complex subunit 1 C-terminal domain-containing protein n=1 Tax=Parelaphostrongylus tenuis TaxID=148309 RepID=A0AAD5N7W7_PARTN|nr:hypothetical protein KIN20_024152 [Parelaphostrongylus tenuis]